MTLSWMILISLIAAALYIPSLTISGWLPLTLSKCKQDRAWRRAVITAIALPAIAMLLTYPFWLIPIAWCLYAFTDVSLWSWWLIAPSAPLVALIVAAVIVDV
ncbi:hypothetical protein [Corallincola spongiicola]|uniref:DUF3325 family protein n=1 Tax=Corallincola spongiicola TaxID=2520508 RepID=A0ABY1WMF6_9GAMM|nr:hypothetical protein [Corallincola spongiicola]TAA43599.1 hypothetical protein EXY25_13665 [Corallincola spongiicola]